MLMFRGFQPQEEVSWQLAETPSIFGGSTLTAQVYSDFIADKITANTSDNNCTLGIYPGTLNTSATATSLTPTTCTVDAVGKVSRVADGLCTVEISAPGSKKNFTRSMLRSAGGISYNQTGFAVGSLSKHISDNIAAMVSGKTAGDATQFIYSGENYSLSAPVGTRNTGLFTTLNLAATSFALTGDARFPLHLISDRHFICATHVKPGIGQTVVFLGNDNVFRSATVSAISLISGAQDTSVGYLSAAITGITPYYFLPSTWKTYLPGIDSTLQGQLSMPVLVNLYHDATGRRRLHIIESPRQAVGLETWANIDPFNSKLYTAWHSVIQGGDSGSPVILPITDGTLKPVLINSLLAASGGAMYPEYITAINSAMTAQAGVAAAVQTVSLAGFTAYP